MGRPGDPVYNATKHALVGMTKSPAVAHAHQGVRANTVGEAWEVAKAAGAMPGDRYSLVFELGVG